MPKLKIGITGQAGFVGSHLYNYLGIFKDKYERIPFKDEYFDDETSFTDFLRQCDVIVHLAALNRHNNPDEIYFKNIELITKLISNLEKTKARPHIIFSSSTQEQLDNIYGKSKKEGRELLIKWCRINGINFTGMIIPNVFGPFGRPFYNSVISTFSYQITHHESPIIDVDNNLKLIYVNSLIEKICRIIDEKIFSEGFEIEHDFESKVTNLLEKLNYYNQSYTNENIVPCFNSMHDINLFNTFRSYMEYDNRLKKIEKREDNRGYLAEITKSNTAGQTFFSATKPGITRGNHFHLRKIERFCVIKGEALIRLRKIGTDEIIEYKVDGNDPSFIDIPIWHTHNIENTGNSELLTLFWTNEIFNPNDPDTYFEEV